MDPRLHWWEAALIHQTSVVFVSSHFWASLVAQSINERRAADPHSIARHSKWPLCPWTAASTDEFALNAIDSLCLNTFF